VSHFPFKGMKKYPFYVMTVPEHVTQQQAAKMQEQWKRIMETIDIKAPLIVIPTQSQISARTLTELYKETFKKTAEIMTENWRWYRIYWTSKYRQTKNWLADVKLRMENL
jgi:hypothetical protein